jgi:hypothetical protein
MGMKSVVDVPFELAFMRPAPPVYSCEDDVMWLNPSEAKFVPEWDTAMCVSNTGGCMNPSNYITV